MTQFQTSLAKIKAGIIIKMVAQIAWYYIVYTKNGGLIKASEKYSIIKWYIDNTPKWLLEISGHISLYSTFIMIILISSGCYGIFKHKFFIISDWFFRMLLFLYVSNGILKLLDKTYESDGVFNNLLHIERMIWFLGLLALTFNSKWLYTLRHSSKETH